MDIHFFENIAFEKNLPVPEIFCQKVYVLFFNQAKGQEALDFVLTMIGRLEDEKHSTVLKEVLSLTNR